MSKSRMDLKWFREQKSGGWGSFSKPTLAQLHVVIRSSYTLLKPKCHSLRCHDFMVHALLLRMHTNVVYFKVMRRLCRREWNWLWNWRCVNQHSWDPWQRTMWSRRVMSDFNSIFFHKPSCQTDESYNMTSHAMPIAFVLQRLAGLVDSSSTLITMAMNPESVSRNYSLLHKTYQWLLLYK